MANVVKYVPAGSSYDPYTDSDVGTVVSYNSSTGRVEFKDIDFNALGSLLGLTKPFTFKDCVLSPNVNPNAIFKPSTTAPYTLADFAGYQHVTAAKYFPLTHTATNPVSSYYTAHAYEFVPYDGLYFDEPPTDFSQMFQLTDINDPDLALWDVSNVTNMSFMFNNTYVFNQDIGGWDTSKVTDMNNMFYHAEVFNQDIGGWNVSNVTDMNNMFYSAYVFNQDLSLWCVSNISSRPYNFDGNANAWTLPKPVWGTCPRGENL